MCLSMPIFRSLPMLILLLLSGAVGASATDWKPWQRLYKDSRIEVQVRFMISPWTSCSNGQGNDIKYEYRVRGRYQSEEQYVNWRMTYLDCENNLMERISCIQIGGSVDGNISNWQTITSDYYQFTGSQEKVNTEFELGAFCAEQTNTLISSSVLESQADGGSIENNDVYELVGSVAPEGIEGKTMVRAGERTNLSVQGGKLGFNAEWVWYLNDCGGEPIGRGARISFQPKDNCEVYVRAEGPSEKSRCTLISLFIDRKSYPATSIKGTPVVCPGTSIELIAEGGYLGDGAEWVWYKDGCGKERIASGRKLDVKVHRNSEYFVRAEGGQNTTTCVSYSVRVRQLSEAPASIVVSKANLCFQEEVTLTVKGGRLGDEAKWVWYSGACTGTKVGTGATLDLKPTANTTYFVRAEGACINTDCVSTALKVQPEMRKPLTYFISTQGEASRKSKMVLSMAHGPFPADTRFRWMRDDCVNGELIAEARTVEVSKRKKRTYFVTATSRCGKIECVRYDHVPDRRNRFEYPGYQRQDLFHAGLGLGLLEWNNGLHDAVARTANGMVRSELIRLQSVGIPVSVQLHPLFTEYVSLGVEASGLASYSTAFFFPFAYNDYEEKSSYLRLLVNGELAVGTRPVKLLVTQGLEWDRLRTKRSSKNAIPAVKHEIDTEARHHVSTFGLRFGLYEPKYKERGSVLDVSYVFRDTDPEVSLLFDPDRLGSYQHGLRVSFWRLSRFRIGLYAMSHTPDTPLWSSKAADLNFGVSFLLFRSMFL